jgi:hypothetical protein
MGRLLHAGDTGELYSGNAAFITGFASALFLKAKQLEGKHSCQQSAPLQ